MAEEKESKTENTVGVKTDVGAVADSIGVIGNLAIEIIKKTHSIPQQKKKFIEEKQNIIREKDQLMARYISGNHEKFGNVIIQLAEHPLKDIKELEEYMRIWLVELNQ